MRADAYAMELHGRSVGVLVAEGRSFRFYASDPMFRSLERRAFNSIAQAERSIRVLAAGD